MMADSGEKDALVSYRLESAKEKLKAAVALLADGYYKDSVGRSYYAIFTAARALLATRRLDSVKHSGVIALFNQHFVKTGVVGKETSKLIEMAKLYRERADYGDYFIVSKEEAESQIESAKKFISEIEKVVNQ